MSVHARRESVPARLPRFSSVVFFALLVLGGALFLAVGVYRHMQPLQENRCAMTYMRPYYVSMPVDLFSSSSSASLTSSSSSPPSTQSSPPSSASTATPRDPLTRVVHTHPSLTDRYVLLQYLEGPSRAQAIPFTPHVHCDWPVCVVRLLFTQISSLVTHTHTMMYPPTHIHPHPPTPTHPHCHTHTSHSPHI
jgi:hypothetical protein